MIQCIGVIGAGVMGQGVAQALAQAELEVLLIDVSDAVLAEAKQKIRQSLRLHRLLSARATRGNQNEVLERICFTTDMESLRAADFIIENVTEKWQVKQPVYALMDKIARPEVIFGVNTSAIGITKVGAATRRPDRVIGMHFMNPVPQKDMVEVIRGFHTSEATVETTRAFLKSAGKDCVIVNDSPGFVSNRVLMLTINEAAYLLHEGVASADDIDQIFRECFEHKMGPLETADLIGVDTILFSIEVLYESLSDSKYRPCPLLRKMVDAGLHGRKNGRGFFDYTAGNQPWLSGHPPAAVEKVAVAVS